MSTGKRMNQDASPSNRPNKLQKQASSSADEEELIEVRGIERDHSLRIPKKAILTSHPGTLLDTILRNDMETKCINLQLNRVQMDLISSYFDTPKKIDLVSFYDKFFGEAVEYLGIPPTDINASAIDLAVHMISAMKPSDVQAHQIVQLKAKVESLQKEIVDYAQTALFKGTIGHKLEQLVPGLKVKSVVRESNKQECGVISPDYIPPHKVHVTTCIFESRYGEVEGAVEVVEEHADTTYNQFNSGAECCHGTERCSLHGIMVGREVVLQYVPKTCQEWIDTILHRDVWKRVEDESLPSYFLKKWRPMLAILNIEPLRRLAFIPADISDASLCEWLQLLSPWEWDILGEDVENE